MGATPHPGARSLVVTAPALAAELTPRRIWGLTALWLAVGLAGMLVVAFGFGPFLFARHQRVLLDEARVSISRAANEAFGLQGVTASTKAPEPGSPIVILEIGAITQQLAVVEGVNPGDTQRAPGHVPGTAAPGQPGNSVIVGRGATFGAPFAELDRLSPGDEILVSTTQGEAVYRVEKVTGPAIARPAGDETSTAEGDGDGPTVDELYGATPDDRLTLVTSRTASLWNTSEATVVQAKMVGKPFPPTPQNGRTDSQTGLRGDPSAGPTLVLVVLGLAGAALTALVLYRTRATYVAYLLSAPPLLAIVLFGGETVSRMLPAWV